MYRTNHRRDESNAPSKVQGFSGCWTATGGPRPGKVHTCYAYHLHAHADITCICKDLHVRLQLSFGSSPFVQSQLTDMACTFHTAVTIPVQIQCRMAKLQAQREELNKIHQTLDAKVTTKHVMRTCMKCVNVYYVIFKGASFAVHRHIIFLKNCIV